MRVGSRSRRAWVALVGACGLAALACGAPRARAEEAPALRVGTSGDYAPFSIAEGESTRGFDVELARRYAADRGLLLSFVRFTWPRLLEDLQGDRFDLAFSGITLRPERSTFATFSLPVVETGAVALVRTDSYRSLDELDRPQVRIGVNAGGHLERVTEQRFPRATRISIGDNAAVLEALRQRAVAAVVTDSAEAPHWLSRMEGLSVLGPFTRDRKAPLVSATRPELAADLDAWLLEREADGSLAALRREHLGEGPWRATATPLAALLSAVDERLSLMSMVAVVKRASGVPLEVPEREDVVLDAASEGVLAAAAARERVAPSVLVIRRFFRAQMEAAKQIQRDTVADHGFDPEPPLPDLDADLRPALLRIGARIARLVVELPPGGQVETVQALADDLLREPRLARSSRRALVEAIAELSPATGAAPDQERTKARASSPASTGSTTQTP